MEGEPEKQSSKKEGALPASSEEKKKTSNVTVD